MFESFTNITAPSIKECLESLARNQAAVARNNSVLGEVIGLRAEVIQAAHKFTRELYELPECKALGIKFSNPSTTNGLVMVGHQPIICHAGILFKSFVLSQLGKEAGLRGIYIIIDTDSGDGGNFYYPCKRESLEICQKNISDSGIFLQQKISETKAVKQSVSEVIGALEALDLKSAAENTREISSWYEALAGQTLVKANAIIRRAVEARFGFSSTYLDLPFSYIIGTSPMQNFIGGLLKDVERLNQIYNTCLTQYRRVRSIKTKANPFPDLGTRQHDGQLFFETPFWLLNKKHYVREPLYAAYINGRLEILSEAGTRQALADIKDTLLVPRAVFTTIILRFMSDLFIHGTGGAKYDAFTDYFVKEYFGIEAPEFVVASATKLLFNDVQKGFGPEKIREISFHPEEYLNLEIFSGKERQDLEKSNLMRQKLVEEIRAGQARGESVADRTRQVKALNQSILKLVEASCRRAYGAVDDQSEHVHSFREFPAFFFMPRSE